MARRKSFDDGEDPVPGVEATQEGVPVVEELSVEQQEINRLKGGNQVPDPKNAEDTQSIKESPLFGGNQGDKTGGDTPAELAAGPRATFRVMSDNLFLQGKKHKAGEEVQLTADEAADLRHHVAKK